MMPYEYFVCLWCSTRFCPWQNQLDITSCSVPFAALLVSYISVTLSSGTITIYNLFLALLLKIYMSLNLYDKKMTLYFITCNVWCCFVLFFWIKIRWGNCMCMQCFESSAYGSLGQPLRKKWFANVAHVTLDCYRRIGKLFKSLDSMILLIHFWYCLKQILKVKIRWTLSASSSASVANKSISNLRSWNNRWVGNYVNEFKPSLKLKYLLT